MASFVPARVTRTAARPTVPLVLHIDYWSGNNSRTSWGAYYRRGGGAGATLAPAGVAVRCTMVMLIKGNLSVAGESERTVESWPGVITNTCGCPFCEKYLRRGGEVEGSVSCSRESGTRKPPAPGKYTTRISAGACKFWASYVNK